MNSQAFESKRVIAERGQETMGVKRSNLRENITIVAKIKAAGNKMPPLVIFEGQRAKVAWVWNSGPPGSWYAATDSSFMQGPVYLSSIKKSKEFIVESGLNDRRQTNLTSSSSTGSRRTSPLTY